MQTSQLRRRRTAVFAKNTHIYGNMVNMKTTLEIPDELFRQLKATAALRGESMKEFVTTALRHRLEQSTKTPVDQTGWLSVFGKASRSEVDEVDNVVEGDLEAIDPRDWE